VTNFKLMIFAASLHCHMEEFKSINLTAKVKAAG